MNNVILVKNNTVNFVICRFLPSHSGTSGPECDDELMESAVARLSSQDELDLISPEG